MENRIQVTYWHHGHKKDINRQLTCLEQLLGTQVGNHVHQVRAQMTRVSNLKKQTGVFLDHLAKRDEGVGVLVGIVPAQEYSGASGNAFYFTRNNESVVSGWVETWMVSGAVAALYRSFAYSCTLHNQGRVMLVHIPQNAGTLITEGVLGRIVTMAKNQTLPFQEVHIGFKSEEDGMPSLVIEMGPKAIVVE